MTEFSDISNQRNSILKAIPLKGDADAYTSFRH